MSFIGFFDPTTLKSILRASNYWASANRNRYPVAITDAIKALYDWVPCPCDDQCQCRREFDCTHHYIRKTGISFELAKSHFLSCYVDQKMRDSVSSGTKKGRGEKAAEATSFFKSQWNNLPAALNTSLLCTAWCNDAWRAIAQDFKPRIETIYKAKWLSLLAFDTFVAYDTGSIRLLIREYPSRTFFDLTSAIRTDLMGHLLANSTSISSFRIYDNPSEFFHPDIPRYHPRPIGNIIDKLFLTL